MATKCKPQGPRFKKFGFWTKVAKMSKPQGPFWLLTLMFLSLHFIVCSYCFVQFHLLRL
ncbi:hypothetical protein Hanom_Chr02g00114891 [Helianthus anomalus]